MTKLSKYALKQLSDQERREYFADIEAEDSLITHCYGGKVIISEDKNNYGWKVEAWDNDDFLINEEWGDTRADVESEVGLLVAELEELEDDSIYGDEDED